jgi:hypothetical protein
MMKNHNRNLLTAGIGLGLGAGLMCLFDPGRGRQRRRFIADQVGCTVKQSREFFEKAGRDLRNRAEGLAHQVKAATKPDSADNEVVEARVRSRLGRVASRTASIDVTCSAGAVTLSGQAPQDELACIEREAKKIPGVEKVINALRPLDVESDEIRPSRRWTPSARLVTGILTGVVGTAAILRANRN